MKVQLHHAFAWLFGALLLMLGAGCSMLPSSGAAALDPDAAEGRLKDAATVAPDSGTRDAAATGMAAQKDMETDVVADAEIDADAALPEVPEPESRLDAYRLQQGDEVELQIYREPELSGTFRLDSSGRIRHPLAGALEIGGLSVSDAEEKLRGILGEKYLVNPRLTLSVVTAQSSNVVILGEVKKPGVHPVPFGESITLLQAIARAGGFTGLASANRVSVIRSVDGKETSIRARVSRMIAGDEPDMPLLPNDVIMVPQVVF